MKIAFDVDDTLIIPSVATGFDRDTPNYDTIALFKWFQAQGHEMFIWSGSGMDWAKTWAEKLGLTATIIIKQKANNDIDIAFDDCDVDLAKVNVKVKRLNNGVSRNEWNKDKTVNIDNKACHTCGVEFVPDLESVIFGTKEWDGHTYKANCEHIPETVRISIG